MLEISNSSHSKIGWVKPDGSIHTNRVNIGWVKGGVVYSGLSDNEVGYVNDNDTRTIAVAGLLLLVR